MDSPQPNDIDKLTINRCVSWYLIHSYLYYKLDSSLLEDTTFDYLCKRLLEEFDNIEHPHQNLLFKSSLRAGTAFHIREDRYPNIVKGAAYDLLDGKMDVWGNLTEKSNIK